MSTKLCWFYSHCDSASPEYEVTPKCQESCSTYSKCKRAYEKGSFPDKFWDSIGSLQNTSEDINAYHLLSQVCKDTQSFVNAGGTIFLHSDISGVGKTFWGVTIAKMYIRQKASGSRYSDTWASYVSVPKTVNDYEILEKFSYDNNQRQAFFNKMYNLQNCDLVVWDDFGFDSDSHVESTLLRSILMSRLSDNKSTIILSSYSIPQLGARMPKMDIERIKSCAIDIELKSRDFRDKHYII